MEVAEASRSDARSGLCSAGLEDALELAAGSCSAVGHALYTYPERSVLAALASHVPPGEELAAIDHPDVRRGLQLLRDWANAYHQGDPTQSCESVETDYVRLFIGAGDPVEAPPWESVYTSPDGLLYQESTLDVRRWYALFGLEAINRHHEPDDHIGLELAFVSFLAEKALDAGAASKEHEFSSAVDALSRFVAEHLVPWVPRWSGLVEQHARTDLYRGLAVLARGLVASLSGQLRQRQGPSGLPGTSTSQ